MSSEHAVVAGGGGFLGSHVCHRLLLAGYRVSCLDNFVTGDRSNISTLLPMGGFNLYECDITQSLPNLGQVDYVLNLASPASPVDYLRLPIATLRVGSVGTENLLSLARANDARFILASTSEVYGDPEIHPQTESYWGRVNPVGPRSVYDEAKRYAEAVTIAYCREYNLNAGVARIFNTYGPKMRLHDGRAIPTFVRQCLLGDPITIAGDGKQTRSVCYVDDLVEGILLLMLSRVRGPINLGNPHELTILDLATKIKAHTASTSQYTFVELPEDDPKIRCPDISCAQDLLGWTPLTPVDTGLARTIEWFRGRLDLR